LASVWRVVRVKTDVVEKIYDEADMHHDEKVSGDTARSATACGGTRPSAMTSAPEVDSDGRREREHNERVVESREVPVTERSVQEGRWIPDEREVRARAAET